MTPRWSRLLLPAIALFVAGTNAEGQTASRRAFVVVESDPPGAEILMSGVTIGVAPDTVRLSPGDTELQAALSGFQPLLHRVELAPADSVRLEFVLLRPPPEMRTAEELGLEFWPISQPRSEQEVETVAARFAGATETFMVFPLAQGLIGLAFFDEDSDYPADTMVIVGASLVVASYLTGKLVVKRQRRQIVETNAIIAESNAAAELHNAEVEQALAESHAANVIVWQQEAENRGVVRATDLRAPSEGD